MLSMTVSWVYIQHEAAGILMNGPLFATHADTAFAAGSYLKLTKLSLWYALASNLILAAVMKVK